MAKLKNSNLKKPSRMQGMNDLLMKIQSLMDHNQALVES